MDLLKFCGKSTINIIEHKFIFYQIITNGQGEATLGLIFVIEKINTDTAKVHKRAYPLDQKNYLNWMDSRMEIAIIIGRSPGISNFHSWSSRSGLVAAGESWDYSLEF